MKKINHIQGFLNKIKSRRILIISENLENLSQHYKLNL